MSKIEAEKIKIIRVAVLILFISLIANSQSGDINVVE